MAQVSGIGGVFVYANAPASLAAWYARHFGLEFRYDEGMQCYYLVFHYRDLDPPSRLLDTVLAIFPAQEPLGRARGEYMINYRVDDLDGLVAQLHAAGIKTTDITVERDEEGYGKFTRLRDPEGNRIELYQPIR